MSEKDLWGRIIRLGFILVFYFGLSFAVLLAVVFRRGFYVDGRAYFSKMMEGTAWRPFVYRVLVPKTAYIMGRLTPEVIQNTVVGQVQRFSKRHHELLLGKNPDYRFEYLFVVGWITLALGLTALVWKNSLAILMKYPEHISFLIPVLGILGTAPILLLYGPYVYDTTTLLLFSIAVYALMTRNRKIFYPTLLLSILNKETSLLLIVLFVISFYRTTPRKQMVAEAALQFLAWGSWRYFLTTLYAANKGVDAEFHLLDYNLPFFTYFSLKHIRFWFTIGAVVLLVGYHWRSKPILLRGLFVASCALLLPLHILFGWIDEFRALLELYPTVFLLSTPALLQSLGFSTDDSRTGTVTNVDVSHSWGGGVSRWLSMLAKRLLRSP